MVVMVVMVMKVVVVMVVVVIVSSANIIVLSKNYTDFNMILVECCEQNITEGKKIEREKKLG